MKNWRDLSIHKNASILDAMKAIDKLGTQFVMVLDENDLLMGVITDGDIRRGLMKNVSFEESVRKILNSKPRVLTESVSPTDARALMKKYHITHIPIVNANNIVVGVFDADEEYSGKNEATVVMMVGGLGTRMGPLTENCPKPMLKIGESPVLEVIVKNLIQHGFKNFVFCVNYKSEVIKAYFGNGSRWGIHIRYVEEAAWLGTAGALSLLPEDIHGQLLIMNGDILTKINFTRLLEFHNSCGAAATMAVKNFELQVPYGVVKSSNDRISKIDEKPIQQFMVNAGIYVIERKFLELLEPDVHIDMPHFFEKLIAQNQFVQPFPVHEYWLDIANEYDLHKAYQEFMSWQEI